MLNVRPLLVPVLTALAASLSVAVLAQTPTGDLYAFTSINPATALGDSPTSQARGISGGVVVGTGAGSATSFSTVALRWNADGTITNLSDAALGDAPLGSIANAHDNGVTVGYGLRNVTNSRNIALRWNANGSVTSLHVQTGLAGSTGMNPVRSQAVAISGGVAVGHTFEAAGSRYSAWRWNADDTATRLPSIGLLGSGSGAFANGVSNGVTVGYGYGSNTGNQSNALLWNADNSVVNLQPLAATLGRTSSIATAISNGVTVGYGFGVAPNGRAQALRWNADGTITSLHDAANLGTNAASFAYAVANGVAVGYGYGDNRGGENYPLALRWNPDGSALDLTQFTDGTAIASAEAIDPTTGVIAGSWQNRAVLWTPLGAGGGGANALAVQPGTTSLINRAFTQNAGTTVVNGTLDMTGNTFTVAGGTLGGAGTVLGNVSISGGTIAPGNSSGTLSITGNFALSGGTFAVELESASSFDRIAATGTAAFAGGTFSVATLGGFTPTVGQFFDIVTTGAGLSGASTVAVPQGYTFASVGNVGRLTFVGAAVVPETGTLALVLLAAPALLAIRRCKN